MKLQYSLISAFCKEHEMHINEVIDLIETKLEWLEQFQNPSDVDEQIKIMI